jgi:hypothetical protein
MTTQPTASLLTAVAASRHTTPPTTPSLGLTSQPPAANAQTAAAVADLEALATELTTRGLQATVGAARGRPPYVDVHNPRASVLAERVYAHAGSFWWSWAERIAPCDEMTKAAAILARVLRTVDEEAEPAQ